MSKKITVEEFYEVDEKIRKLKNLYKCKKHVINNPSAYFSIPESVNNLQVFHDLRDNHVAEFITTVDKEIKELTDHLDRDYNVIVENMK
jgi:hypothetical protein